jgi:hypothetical protein
MLMLLHYKFRTSCSGHHSCFLMRCGCLPLPGLSCPRNNHKHKQCAEEAEISNSPSFHESAWLVPGRLDVGPHPDTCAYPAFCNFYLACNCCARTPALICCMQLLPYICPHMPHATAALHNHVQLHFRACWWACRWNHLAAHVGTAMSAGMASACAYFLRLLML